LCLCACSGRSEAPEPAASEPAQVAPTPAATAPKPAPPLAALADPNEACGQIIVIAYKDAAHAKAGITRDKAAAAQRASELLQKARSGADFAELARSESDAPSSAPRGGIMGTFVKAEWPALHGALRDPLFALQVGQIAPAPVEADYGYVLVRRCPVEKAHARHILVRFKGGKRSDASVKRTREQAKLRAAELLQQLKTGADFAELARTASEDGSAKRGGDIGTQGRGSLALPFEQALFALQPGELSGIVETEFGYHIIERMSDGPGPILPRP
jgi:peptidyl-prolyl cis-trans isomerase SurA